MTAGFLENVNDALRASASKPLYAAASIAVLAIAIGANTPARAGAVARRIFAGASRVEHRADGGLALRVTASQVR